MKARARFFFRIASLVIAAPTACAGTTSVSPARDRETPPFVSQHVTRPEDVRAIEELLATYPRAVTEGDAASFDALLLSPSIVFTAVDRMTAHDAVPAADLQGYPGFRKSVFESGRHYVQRFYNVRVEQDGDLAQASLDFVTQSAESGKGGFGWKSIQLVKAQGRWKIASVIYTIRDLPPSPAK